MDWNDWLTILRWRAIEEGDTDAVILSEGQRREATGRTRAGMTSEMVTTDRVGDRESAFLLRRALWLEHELIGWSGILARVMERLNPVKGRRLWIIAGWLAAFIIGYTLAGLGQEAEFNLLALPLVGVLVWNGVIMTAALLIEFKQEGRSRSLEWLASRLTPASNDRNGDAEASTGMTVDQRFEQLARGAKDRFALIALDCYRAAQAVSVHRAPIMPLSSDLWARATIRSLRG